MTACATLLADWVLFEACLVFGREVNEWYVVKQDKRYIRNLLIQVSHQAMEINRLFLFEVLKEHDMTIINILVCF